jgi:predicted MFS family arabinose efflux permease
LGSPGLVRATLTLSTTQLISWGVLFYAFAVAAPAMRADTGWSTAATAGAYSTGLAVAGLAAPATARLLATHGPRQVMSWGSAAGGCGMTAWALAPNVLVLYAAWTVIGLAMAATFYEPAFAVVVALDPARRRRTVALLTTAGGLASAVFAPLTTALVGRMGWRGAVALLGLTGGAITLAAHRIGLPGTLEPPSTPSSARVTSAITPPRRLVVASVLEQAAQVAATTHLVALLVVRGVSTSTAAAALAVLGLGKVAGRLLLVGDCARRTAARLLAWCSVVQLLSLTVVVTASEPLTLFSACAAAGAAAGATTVLRPLLVTDLVGIEGFPAANGRLARSSSLARAAGPLIVGAAVTPIGWRATWLLTLALFAVAAERYARLRDGAVTAHATTNVRPSATLDV